MAKNFRICILLDYYKAMLTEKQAEVIDLYYNQDLSLAEISELMDVTRQGIRDHIKRGEESLMHLEEKLHLAEKAEFEQQRFDQMHSVIEELAYLNQVQIHHPQITRNTKELEQLLEELNGVNE
ncbi:YlxM family DNA-binding protein [Acetivibrio sp. MSJd-27]|uniref:YlxM family DNA-binding protein n=1 Tax=Acetivibrio sp. MSJd-27 TaxID=2841523 RepID=UPI001C122FC0|nr:YlxM family DNA-binding protein [Acetivibrio sp. MSJd-27]MBU5450361.1 YlxM family DNA-binding protein [Acetivibrio sp. MSJd-27]